MRHRFQVIEYSSGFALYDTKIKREHWMSDGVDCLFTETGKAVSPGAKTFRKRLQAALNERELETLEAYWPEQYLKETEDEL